MLEARGDSLWVGPCLTLTVDGGVSFRQPPTDRLCAGESNRLTALDGEGDVLVAGLGRTTPDGASAAAGFLLSRDGGQSFTYRFPQTDTDSTAARVQYGANLLPAQIITERESTPFAVDYVPRTGAIWVAGRASGLRRSTDGGETFERIVLPPDSLDAISPLGTYDFPLQPEPDARPQGPGFFNHLVNSVLVDETGTVWAGTSAGVNRSRPQDVFVFERPDGSRYAERAWRRFGFDNTAAPGASDTLGDGLTGNFVPRISEQPLPEGQRNPIWMSTRPTVLEGEERGVTFTRDGGRTFHQTLRGEVVYDFAFRGETVYAASRRGVFISERRTDTSYTWRLVDDFVGAGFPDAAVDKARRVFAVATTEEALWAGTEDGLLKSRDGGGTWEVFRTRVPTDPEEPTEAVPRVETYAYPNPFSPVAAPSGVVRIVAEVGEPAPATVQLYDFAMDFVRELAGDCDLSGRCEISWDGTGADGARVANGIYFYEIEAAGETARGKIMVME